MFATAVCSFAIDDLYCTSEGLRRGVGLNRACEVAQEAPLKSILLFI